MSPKTPDYPIERLWQRYRDRGLTKYRTFSGKEMGQHRESFFAGATALLALFSAPFQLGPEHTEALANPQLMKRWLEDICTELNEHNDRGAS